MWEALMAIFAAVIGGITNANNISAQREANEANINASRESLELQQQYARENAEYANKESERMYWELMSPQAKVQQYKDAGLNPALMYSMGGTGGGTMTAQMATAPSPTTPTINPTLQTNYTDQLINAMKATAETKKTNADIDKIDKEIDVMDATINEINAKIANFEADTGLKMENTNFIKVQSITENWKAKLAELDANFAADTYDKRKELLNETIEKIGQERLESERRIMGMDIEQDQKMKMFELEQRRIIAETTKAQAAAARDFAEKAKAEIQKRLLEAQAKGEEEKVKYYKEQNEQMKKQTKILEEQVHQAEMASKMSDWEYSTRLWTKINETIGVMSGAIQAGSSVTRAVKMPNMQQ